MGPIGTSTPGTGPIGVVSPGSAAVVSPSGAAVPSALVTVSGTGVPPSPLQDRIAAVLAVLIAGVVLGCYLDTFIRAQAENQQDLLMLGFSLIGTVTGYYFGRSPADRAVSLAQTATQTATQAATQANAISSETARGLLTAQRELALTKARARQSLGEALAAMRTPEERSRSASADEGVDRARQVLESAIRTFE